MKFFKKKVKDEDNPITLEQLSEEGTEIAAEQEFGFDMSNPENAKEFLDYQEKARIALKMVEEDTALEVIATQNVVARDGEYKIDVFLPVLTANFPCEEKDIFKPSVYLTEEKANKMADIINEELIKSLKDINDQLNQENQQESFEYFRAYRKYIKFNVLFYNIMKNIRNTNDFFKECLEEYKQVRDPLIEEARQKSSAEAEEYRKGDEQRQYERKQREILEKEERMRKETEEIRNKQKEMYVYPEMDVNNEDFAIIDYERGHSEEDKFVYYWPEFKTAPFNKPKYSFDHIYTSEKEAIHALNKFKEYYEFVINTYKESSSKLSLEQILDEAKRLFDLDSFNINAKKTKKQNSSNNVVNSYEIVIKDQFKDYSLQQLDSIAFKFKCHISYLDINGKKNQFDKEAGERKETAAGTIALSGLEENIIEFLKETCFYYKSIPNSKINRSNTSGDLQYKESAYGYGISEEQTFYTEKIKELENDQDGLIYALTDYSPSNIYAATMNRDTNKETFVPSFLRSPFVNAFKALDKEVKNNLFFKNEENAWDILNDFLKYCFQDETLRSMLFDLEELTNPIKQTVAGNDKEKTQKEKDKNAKSRKIKKLKESAVKVIEEKAKEFFNLDTTKKKIDDDHISMVDLYEIDKPKLYLIRGNYAHTVSLPKIVNGEKKTINLTPKRELIMITPSKNIKNKNNNAYYSKSLLLFVPDMKIYPLLCEQFEEDPDNFNWDTLYDEYFGKYKAWFEGIVFNEIESDLLNFREKYGIVKWNEIKDPTEIDKVLTQYITESTTFNQFKKLCEPIKTDAQGNVITKEVITKDLHGRDVVNYVPEVNDDVELTNDTVVDYYNSIDFIFTNQENEDFSYDRDTIQNLADTCGVKLISYEELNPYDLDKPEKLEELSEEQIEKLKELDEKDAGLSTFYQVKGKGKNILDFVYAVGKIHQDVKYPLNLKNLIIEKNGQDLTYSPFTQDKTKLENSIKANLLNLIELGYLSYKDRLYKYS